MRKQVRRIICLKFKEFFSVTVSPGLRFGVFLAIFLDVHSFTDFAVFESFLTLYFAFFNDYVEDIASSKEPKD